jgi:glycosyltransferase involved in cell wall biosynthesis
VASVVIPVRNRQKTIGDAITSALSQDAAFEFNVIVVDNHSTDGTGEVIEGFSDPKVVRIVPEETHLGIGGCWNEAVFSTACGRVAVQLDSDDLYAGPGVLGRVVGEMRENGYAMLVAAYTTVDFGLSPLAPGLVDHREWTWENGHNNVLRINGFGAPRAFDVGVLRGFGFPNASYGEDYAVGLRISREYEVGRVFDPVYLCRRWEGNTDSRLPPEVLNRFNAYKDWLRTMEIGARRAMNARETERR